MSQQQSTNAQQPSQPVSQPVSQPYNTVLAFFNIGGAFKDLVQSLVNNIIQPLIIKLLVLTNIYNIGMFSSILSGKNSALNITSTISSLISFIIITVTVYLLYTLINVN